MRQTRSVLIFDKLKSLTGKFTQGKSKEEDSEEVEFDLSEEDQEDFPEDDIPSRISAEDATGEFQYNADATQDIDEKSVSRLLADVEERPQREQTRTVEESLDENEDEDEQEEEEFSEEEGLSKGQKILQQLSEKLPFLSKIISSKNSADSVEEDEQSDSSDDEEDQGPAEKSKLQTLLEEKLPFLAPLAGKVGKGKPPKDGDENGEEKPKKKIKVIHILIVGLLAVFLLMEEEPAQKAPPVVKPTPKYKKVEKKPAEPKQETPTEIQTPEPEPVPEPTISETEPAQEPVVTEPTETPTSSETTEAPEEPEVKDELDTLFEDETIANEPQEQPVEEPEQPTDDSSVAAEVEEEPQGPVVPNPYQQPEVQPEPDLDASPKKSISEELKLDDQMVDQVAEGAGGGEEITEAILKQLEKTAKQRRDETVGAQAVEPTEAPSYLDPGPGLVYNCAGGHWACVSTKAFGKCGKNYAWNLKEAKALECYPSELYQSEMDCASMQQYKTDMAAETEFCR